MPYFDEIKTLGELKKEFRRLAQENHPDHGGDPLCMRDIICEYQRLAKILPDIGLEPEDTADVSDNNNEGMLVFSHKEICLLAKSLFVYGHPGDTENLQGFYRKLCRIIDPGQCKSYCDYHFNRKIALQSLKLMKSKVLNRIFTAELWTLFKTSRNRLQKTA